MRMHLAGPARVRLRDSFLVDVAFDGTYEQPPSNGGTVTIRRRIE